MKALKESKDKVEKTTLEKIKAESDNKMTARVNSNLKQMMTMMKGRTEWARGLASSAVSPSTTAALGAWGAGMSSQARTDDVRNKGKCYKYEKGQCSDQACNFLHPEEVCEVFARNGIYRERSCLRLHKGEHRGDCFYWKQGSCRYSEEECGKGLHRHEMFDFNNQRKQR